MKFNHLPQALWLALNLATSVSGFSIPAIITRDTPAESNVTDVFRSADSIHELVLKNWPADQITTSDKLSEYLEKHLDELKAGNAEDRAVYISDTKSWLTLLPDSAVNQTAQLNDTAGALARRQDGTCFYYEEQRIRKTHEHWGPWHAMSACKSSGDNPAGGYITYEVSDSISRSYGGG